MLRLDYKVKVQIRLTKRFISDLPAFHINYTDSIVNLYRFMKIYSEVHFLFERMRVRERGEASRGHFGFYCAVNCFGLNLKPKEGCGLSIPSCSKKDKRCCLYRLRSEAANFYASPIPTSHFSF